VTPRVRVGAFLLGGLLLAAALAFFVSPESSDRPDGLERVALDSGFAATAQPHALEELPTAGYGVRGVDDDRLSRGFAGLLGVAVTFAIAGGALVVLKKVRPAPRSST
jgi:hypothetical protein